MQPTGCNNIMNKGLMLAPWIAGRYCPEASTAILFNNLLSETYLFEEQTASLIGQLLKYDYLEHISFEKVAERIGCKTEDIVPFSEELERCFVLIDHNMTNTEIRDLRQQSALNKKQLLTESNGTEDLQSIFSLVDTDYRDRTVKYGIPSTVSFELTYGCNEMCIHCYNPGAPHEICKARKASDKEMQYEDYVSALDQLEAMGVQKVLFTGGDPFIKKDFLRILGYAHTKKFAISIYTNGQTLYNRPDIYQKVVELYPHDIGLSLYSTDPEIHDKITRVKGSYVKTMSIEEKLSNVGVDLKIKCPIMRINRDSYRAVHDFALSINAVPEFELNITSGVDGNTYAVDNLRLSEEEMAAVLRDPLIPLSPNRKNTSRMMERDPDMNFCGAGEGINIQPDGNVCPCIAFPMRAGNARTDNLKDIYNSVTFNNIRNLKYRDSDRCGKESYCKWCNRCIGQSFIATGNAANASEDNCFIARLRERISLENREKQ